MFNRDGFTQQQRPPLWATKQAGWKITYIIFYCSGQMFNRDGLTRLWNEMVKDGELAFNNDYDIDFNFRSLLFFYSMVNFFHEIFLKIPAILLLLFWQLCLIPISSTYVTMQNLFRKLNIPFFPAKFGSNHLDATNICFAIS